jgi:hypothetical protein
MDKKCRTFKPGKKHLFLDISSTNIDALVSLLFIALSVCQPAAGSLLTVVSATSTPPVHPLRHWRNICHQDGFLVDQTDGSD